MTVPGAMPGQLDALSAQLAAGYGQSQPDILALLNQYYQPMQLPDYSPQPAATPTTPAVTAPVTRAPLDRNNGRAGGRDPNGGINR